MFFAGAAGDQFFQYGIKSMIGQRCLIKRREADIEIFASFLVEKFSECLHIVGAAYIQEDSAGRKDDFDFSVNMSPVLISSILPKACVISCHAPPSCVTGKSLSANGSSFCFVSSFMYSVGVMPYSLEKHLEK